MNKTGQLIARTTVDKPPSALVKKTHGPGIRVGIKLEQVLAAAHAVLATRPAPINVKAVAAKFNVAHASISVPLKKRGTTLERELARAFLRDITKPMIPGEDWRDHLRDLFQDALRECEAHPGLARAIAVWLAESPHFCPDFTEALLHVLCAAGLSDVIIVKAYEIVLATLCGMLIARFPFQSDPTAWANEVAHEMRGIYERRHPLMHRLQDGLAASAKDKASAAIPDNGPSTMNFSNTMAALLICAIESKCLGVERGDDHF